MGWDTPTYDSYPDPLYRFVDFAGELFSKSRGARRAVPPYTSSKASAARRAARASPATPKLFGRTRLASPASSAPTASSCAPLKAPCASRAGERTPGAPQPPSAPHAACMACAGVAASPRPRGGLS
ncbi:unnamed protein product [Urochloa humidicola]